jgi:hypothetical protein
MPGPDQQRLLFNLAARIRQVLFAQVKFPAGPQHEPRAHHPRSMIITAPMVGCTSC